MIIRLQITYENKIILVSCGVFYTAIGADAVILNRELGLKTICAKTRICKVGIPKNSLDKYREELDKLGYSYIIFDYDKEKKKLVKIHEKDGKKKKVHDYNKGCYCCSNKKNTILTEYEEALNKYFSKEFGVPEIW